MKTLIDLEVGETLEQAEWLTISQDMINQFAEATGDYQWIHLDTERCNKESPFRTTIAHGFLTASVMPKAFEGVLAASDEIASTINYGIDSLRFLEPVKSGDAIYRFLVRRKCSSP